MDYQAILEEIHAEVGPRAGAGRVADYIPALGRVPADRFAMALRTVDGEEFRVGHADERFSIQSISKVFTLTMALRLVGEGLFGRVGREPSGTPFNSLVQLESENGRPRNPLINAGALVVADVLLSALADAKSEVLSFVRGLCGGGPSYDPEVVRSERRWGDRNAALAHFLKSFGNLDNTIESVLDLYTHHCGLAMTCGELARCCSPSASSARLARIWTGRWRSSGRRWGSRTRARPRRWSFWDCWRGTRAGRVRRGSDSKARWRSSSSTWGRIIPIPCESARG